MKAAVFVKLGRMEVARPGAIVGRVGVPHTGDINIGDYWMANLAMAGGRFLAPLMTKKSC